MIDGYIVESKEAEKNALVIAKRVEEGKATPEDIELKARLIEKVSTLNQSLISISSQAYLKPRVYFHIQEESQRNRVKRLADEIEDSANVIVPGIQRLAVGPTITELRYFKSAEEQEARNISDALSSLGLKVETKYVQGFESSSKIRPRHYELWISKSGI